MILVGVVTASRAFANRRVDFRATPLTCQIGAIEVAEMDELFLNEGKHDLPESEGWTNHKVSVGPLSDNILEAEFRLRYPQGLPLPPSGTREEDPGEAVHAQGG
jgi:hypothetical protein